MNWAGVTCLSWVYPAGRSTSRPPYLAETHFQVPTSGCADLASTFGASAGAAAAANQTTAPRDRMRVTDMVGLTGWGRPRARHDVPPSAVADRCVGDCPAPRRPVNEKRTARASQP